MPKLFLLPWEKVNKSGEFRMTHRATAKRWSFSSHMVPFAECFCFSGRTDTMCENKDHLFGRGPVGQCHFYTEMPRLWVYLEQLLYYLTLITFYLFSFVTFLSVLWKIALTKRKMLFWQLFLMTFCLGSSFFQLSQQVLLIHSADPQSRPVVIIVFAHVVRPSPIFKI